MLFFRKKYEFIFLKNEAKQDSDSNFRRGNLLNMAWNRYINGMNNSQTKFSLIVRVKFKLLFSLEIVKRKKRCHNIGQLKFANMSIQSKYKIRETWYLENAQRGNKDHEGSNRLWSAHYMLLIWKSKQGRY